METTNNQNFTYSTSLSDGTYTFQVYANDTYGNTNHTENITFSVDTPEEDDSSGGGGGGGGSAAAVLQSTDFSVSPSSLTISIVEGETDERTIEVTNNGKETISVGTEVSIIDNLLELSDEKFSLEPGESRIIRAIVKIEKAGLYVGKIYISSGNTEEIIKVAINGASEDVNFDSSLVVGQNKNIVERGESLVTQLNIIPQDGPSDVKKEYKVTWVIKNFNGEKFLEKTIFVESYDEAEFLENIPTDDLPSGSYTLGIIVESTDSLKSSIDTSSVQFVVKDDSQDSSKNNFVLMIILISSALALILFSYFFLTRRKMLKKVLKYEKGK
jgi:hypothetical protein